MWKINTACGGSLSEFAFQRPPVQERTINVLTQKRFPDWLRHSRMTRIAILATEDDMPWSNREGIQLRGVPACRRSMDVINVAWLYRLHGTGALTEADEAAAVVEVSTSRGGCGGGAEGGLSRAFVFRG